MDKAIFLLKFAGLSRVEEDAERENKTVSTATRLRQQLSLVAGQTSSIRRPASFDLVLSFVRNEAITEKRIHSLLQDRETSQLCGSGIHICC